MVLADHFARISDLYFGDVAAHPGAWEAWSATFAFAMQIFFDFSGYTDIARGCGRLLGYEFPVNFRRPYLARSITEFWRRWHISLSSWLRDYLYIPLGGNRKGRQRTYENLMVTMLLGGSGMGPAGTSYSGEVFTGCCWRLSVWQEIIFRAWPSRTRSGWHWCRFEQLQRSSWSWWDGSFSEPPAFRTPSPS